MKRKLLILSLLMICVATFAVGSVAYFNAEETAHNVITTGGVQIALQEWADVEKKTPFEDLEGVMPKTSVTKIAEVKNTGASDAWIRVQVVKNIQIEGEGTPNLDLIELDLNTTDWTLGTDGYLYYNEPLAPGEVTVPVFTSVTFDETMDNMYRGATITVSLLAQAVQSANNGATVSEANGWPAGM